MWAKRGKIKEKKIGKLKSSRRLCEEKKVLDCLKYRSHMLEDQNRAIKPEIGCGYICKLYGQRKK